MLHMWAHVCQNPCGDNSVPIKEDNPSAPLQGVDPVTLNHRVFSMLWLLGPPRHTLQALKCCDMGQARSGVSDNSPLGQRLIY